MTQLVQLVYESVQDPANWTAIMATYLEAAEHDLRPPLEALIDGVEPLRQHSTSQAAATQALDSLLNALPWGVAFLDERAQLLRHNTRFTQLLRHNPDLEVVHGHLRFTQQQRLLDALSKMAHSHTAQPTLSINDPSLHCSVTLRPLVSPDATHLIMSWWFDNRIGLSASDELFQRLYGLTRAESRVTELCLQGLAQTDIAKVLDLSLNTVKTHLKSIYAKTGCTQLAALIRKIFTDVLQMGEMPSPDTGPTPPLTTPSRSPSSQLTLRDGRRLSWADDGPAEGLAMLIFGPTGICKEITLDISDTLRTLHMRSIYIERPGLGASDPHPQMTDDSWMADIGELTRHLGLRHWVSVGISFGARESVLLAQTYPAQTVALHWVSPMLPHGVIPLCKGHGNTPLQLASRMSRFPFAVFKAAMSITLHQMLQHPDRYLHRVIEQLPLRDQLIFHDAQKRELFAQALLAYARSSGKQWIEQLYATYRPWPGLSSLKLPMAIHLGSEDCLYAPDAAQHWLKHQPSPGQLFHYPQGGHHMALYDWRRIATAIAQHARAGWAPEVGATNGSCS